MTILDIQLLVSSRFSIELGINNTAEIAGMSINDKCELKQVHAQESKYSVLLLC
jgi:hypothetical protein